MISRFFCFGLLFMSILSLQGQPAFEFDCGSSPVSPPSFDSPSQTGFREKWLLPLGEGANKPELLCFWELPFEHRGVSMPQWCKQGKFLAVQAKPISSKIPYEVHLFSFPDRPVLQNEKLIFHGLVQDSAQKSTFYSFRWSRRLSSEFCVISGSFHLYWGKAGSLLTPGEGVKNVPVFPLFQGDGNITQPGWFHRGKEDYLAFLKGNQIFIGRLSPDDSERPRQFVDVWRVPMEHGELALSGVSYFQAFGNEKGVKMLVCGNGPGGEGIFLVGLNGDLRIPERAQKIGDGIYKLPEWNETGEKAFVYRVQRISPQSSAQELYLYVYTQEGHGDILHQTPTIQNEEKEPEHDYLGPLWARWKIDTTRFEGTCHFFKQSTEPQQFKLVFLPVSSPHLQYKSSTVNMGKFSSAFGRGRCVAFGGNHTYRNAFVFYDAARQKNILYIGMMNFETER